MVLHNKLIGVWIHSDGVGHIQAADLGRTTHRAEQTSRFKPTSSRADTWSFVSHARQLSTFSSLVCETTWSGDRCMHKVLIQQGMIVLLQHEQYNTTPTCIASQSRVRNACVIWFSEDNGTTFIPYKCILFR